MERSGSTGQRLTALFVLGCVLLNYPVLSLFSRPVEVAGIPLLYAYLFGVWLVLIGGMALVIGRRRE
ncbi:MAG TPA: hypothetical protein VFP65_10955 [Anaeromyxobacteraceae bacterium]|jgi:hypothetical protein|nr:hypothetical protein [Anaeromyxobacteraceae bacterium]